MRWKRQDKTQWHRVFAWYPVTTVCDTVVWLEYLEYRGADFEMDTTSCWVYRRLAQYRLIEEEKQ
jgi:hypothetical protein